MTIRQEIIKDYTAVYNLHVEAFSGVAEANLVEKLRMDESFIPELSLVAELKHQVIGHVLFTKAHIVNASMEKTDCLALAPLAVNKGNQGKGIGSKLVTFGLNVCESLGWPAVIVLGHKTYYSRFGFMPASNWNIHAPFKLTDSDNFMAIELVKGGLRNERSTMEYAKPFQTF